MAFPTRPHDMFWWGSSESDMVPIQPQSLHGNDETGLIIGYPHLYRWPGGFEYNGTDDGHRYSLFISRRVER